MKHSAELHNDYIFEKNAYINIMYQVFEAKFYTPERMEKVNMGISLALRDGKEELRILIHPYRGGHTYDFNFACEIEDYFSKKTLIGKRMDKNMEGVEDAIKFLDNIPVHFNVDGLVEEVLERSDKFEDFCRELHNKGYGHRLIKNGSGIEVSIVSLQNYHLRVIDCIANGPTG